MSADMEPVKIEETEINIKTKKIQRFRSLDRSKTSRMQNPDEVPLHDYTELASSL